MGVLFFSKVWGGQKENRLQNHFFFNPTTTMKLLQTITVSDSITSHGYLTLIKNNHALFWLYALCERHSQAHYCKKEQQERETVFSFTGGEIRELHTNIDKWMRKKENVKFPLSEFMDKYQGNTTSRTKDDMCLLGEIGSVLTFLAPLRNLINYVEGVKEMKIKFTEQDDEE